MQDFLYEALIEQDTLCHHGILGQKWGVRRYQNKDGSLTEAGKKRYLNSDGTLNKSGAKRLRERGDGTYYDVTKYSRKLGLVGAAIDLGRLAKENKTHNSSVSTKTKTIKRPESATDEYNTVSDAFKKSGWKVDDSGDFGGDIYAEKSSKLGPDNIKVYTVVDPGDKSGYINEHIKTLDSKIKKLESNSDTIYKQTSKFIADDLYNDNVDDVKDKMTLQEYRKALKATGAYITDWDTLDIDFSHPEHGSHILSVEYDLNNLKPIIERGVRMDG